MCVAFICEVKMMISNNIASFFDQLYDSNGNFGLSDCAFSINQTATAASRTEKQESYIRLKLTNITNVKHETGSSLQVYDIYVLNNRVPNDNIIIINMQNE